MKGDRTLDDYLQNFIIGTGKMVQWVSCKHRNGAHVPSM